MSASTIRTEADLAALVDAVRADTCRRDELVAVLREDAAVHRHQSTAVTARLRGWVLNAFADVGLPADARPFVLEELTSSREPHLVAAAARAARGAARPDDVLVRALAEAIVRIHDRDAPVTFESLAPTWPARSPTTATTEVLGTLLAMGPDAAAALPSLRELITSRGRQGPARREIVRAVRALEAEAAAAPRCCASAGESLETADGGDPVAPGRAIDLAIELQDQDGTTLTFRELLCQPLTVLAFFYTRCPNPEKCSATITNLAIVQTIAGAGIGIAAVSYDRGYDTPARLRTYGEARGIQFGPSARLVRARRDGTDLAAALGLRVGYNGSVVNRHAIELYLVTADGRVAQTWTRVRWEPLAVVAAARRHLAAARQTLRSM